MPPLAAPATVVTLRTRDGVRLVADHLPGPPAADDGRPMVGVVVAHGFGAHRRKPAYGLLSEHLVAAASVLALDLRGHGSSGGSCTLGDVEVLDLVAAAAWLRRRGCGLVVGIGVSMGGAALLRAAGSGPPRPSGPRAGYDAICTISSPAVWGLERTPALRMISWMATHPAGRLAARGLRVRVADRWGRRHPPEPPAPVDVIGRIAPVPVLLVHGEDDHFFDLAQAEALLAAGGPGTVLWREPLGFGHAEDGLRPAFLQRLVAGVGHLAAAGAWPERASEQASPAASGVASD